MAQHRRTGPPAARKTGNSAPQRKLEEFHRPCRMDATEAESGPDRSTRSILLPQFHALSETEEAKSRTCALQGNEHILFVDDEPLMVEITTMMLERMGGRVTAFTSAAEALRAFEADPAAFDCIITDQVMPGMSGSALAERVLAIRDDVPIIFCTGSAESITEERTTGTGIREFVAKPIVRAELAAAITKALARSNKK